MGLYGYIFGSTKTATATDKKDDLVSKPVVVPNVSMSCKCKKKDSYFVITNKTSEAILGIYDNLEKAKNAGKTNTYHNCRIMHLKLNNINHLNRVVYEDK